MHGDAFRPDRGFPAHVHKKVYGEYQMLRMFVVIWLVACGIKEVVNLASREYDKTITAAKISKILILMATIHYVIN